MNQESKIIKLNMIAMTIFDAENKMMTMQEAMDFLKLSRRGLQNKIERGEIITSSFDQSSGRKFIPKIQFMDELISAYKEKGTEMDPVPHKCERISIQVKSLKHHHSAKVGNLFKSII